MQILFSTNWLCFLLSEIFSRFMSTSLFGKRHMLHYMLPWLKNIELSLHDEEEKILDAGASQKMFEIPLHMLRACGWGSPSATHFLLSNLTYITIRVSLIVYFHVVGVCGMSTSRVLVKL